MTNLRVVAVRWATEAQRRHLWLCISIPVRVFSSVSVVCLCEFLSLYLHPHLDLSTSSVSFSACVSAVYLCLCVYLYLSIFSFISTYRWGNQGPKMSHEPPKPPPAVSELCVQHKLWEGCYIAQVMCSCLCPMPKTVSTHSRCSRNVWWMSTWMHERICCSWEYKLLQPLEEWFGNIK